VTSRVMTVVLSLALAFTVAACGGDDDSAGNGPESTQARQSYEIVFLPTVTTDPFFVTMGCAAREAANSLNVDLDIQGPETASVPEQVSITNAALASRPDAIIISPGDDKALTAPLKQAVQQGIEVFFVDKATSDMSFASGFIATDNVAGGGTAGELMADLIGREGSVMALGGTPVPVLAERADGFVDGIAGAAPDVKYLGNEFDPSFAVDKHAAIVSAALNKNPDLRGVFGLYGQMADAAVSAIRSAGKTGEVRVISFDATPTVVKSLRNGAVDAILVQKPEQIGAMAVEQLVEVLDGGKPKPPTEVGTETLTRENLETKSEFLYRDNC
jgi:ribose transport system substrate-binding protein